MDFNLIVCCTILASKFCSEYSGFIDLLSAVHKLHRRIRAVWKCSKVHWEASILAGILLSNAPRYPNLAVVHWCLRALVQYLWLLPLHTNKWWFLFPDDFMIHPQIIFHIWATVFRATIRVLVDATGLLGTEFSSYQKHKNKIQSYTTDGWHRYWENIVDTASLIFLNTGHFGTIFGDFVRKWFNGEGELIHQWF